MTEPLTVAMRPEKIVMKPKDMLATVSLLPYCFCRIVGPQKARPPTVKVKAP